MRRIFGLILAGALCAGQASEAKAQFNLSVGGPFGGGVSISSGYNPYGIYSSGFYPYSYSSYGAYAPGFSAYGMGPGTSYYSSGYSGLYPGAGYGYSGLSTYYPATTVYSYGYPGYGYMYGYRPGLGARIMGRVYGGYW